MTSVFARTSLCLAVAFGTGPRLPTPEFKIDLDKAPEERFAEVVGHFQEPLSAFIQYLHAGNKTARILGGLVAAARGKENDELQREIEGIAKLAGVTAGEIHAMQMLYEFNTLMVPIVNFTGPLNLDLIADAMDAVAAASIMQWQDGSFPIRFGCTGIIATDKDDGTVYHGRNLDFSFAKYLQAMTYTGIFTKAGREIFRAQTIAGYAPILTGMRMGSNGFTIEVNTRFASHLGDNGQMFRNLFKDKREISGWTKRKILENNDNYEDAVEAFSNTPYPASEYNFVAGVKKGIIIARDPDGVAYTLPLNESSKDYVIMTNFDYPWHDIKEAFDPTSVRGLGHSRRKDAQKILDAAPVVTPDVIFDALNDNGAMSKETIFQVIMNVEKGLWNASLPACVHCGRGSEVVV